MGTDFALIHRGGAGSWCDGERGETPSEQHVVLVGSVAGRTAIIIDDLADTGATLSEAAAILRLRGARTIYAMLTHGIFSSDAIATIESSEIDTVIVSNSVPRSRHIGCCSEAAGGTGKFQHFDVSPLIGEAIRRAHRGQSLSVLSGADAFNAKGTDDALDVKATG